MDFEGRLQSQGTALVSAQIREHVRKVLASPELAGADRLCQLLTYLVETVLEGNASHLKEAVIGVQVFHKEIGYDPKQDPVVRVAARRLRSKLETYYQGSGAGDPIRVLLPKGGYIPEFAPAPAVPEPEVAVEVPIRPEGEIKARKRRLLLSGLAIAVFAVLAVGGYMLILDRPGPQGLHARPFSAMEGYEYRPVFSPDGRYIAFDYDGDVWVQRVDGDAPRRLTSDPRKEISAVWSPEGASVAFLRELPNSRVGIFSTPLVGSGEKAWGELDRGFDEFRLDWSADGRWFAVPDRPDPKGPSRLVLISTETLKKTVLTTPPAGIVGDNVPSFSPDSRFLAFRRTLSVSVEDVYAIPVAGGELRRITQDNRGISGISWANGKELIISSRRAGGSFRGLWRIPLEGGMPERLVLNVPEAAAPSISRAGDNMAFVVPIFDVNIWALDLGSGKPPRRMIASTLLDSSPQTSPDLSSIAFRSNRSGSDEIWVAPMGGGAASRVTQFNGPLSGSPRWSPDSKWIAFETRIDHQADVYVVSPSGASLRRLTVEPSNEILASWARDGRCIYFASDRTGSWQIWRQEAAGAKVVQVTRNGGFAAFESPDGRHLYYSKGGRTGGIWRIAISAEGASGEESKVLDVPDREMWGNWAVTEKGIYFIERTNRYGVIRFFDFATGSISDLHQLTRPAAANDSGLAVSADGATLLFSQVDVSNADIYIVDSFR
jgi:Tol biopolymer transport system component